MGFGAFPSKFTASTINNEWNIMRWNPDPAISEEKTNGREQQNKTSFVIIRVERDIERKKNWWKKYQQSANRKKTTRNCTKKNLIVTRDKHCMKWPFAVFGILSGKYKINSLANAIQPRNQKNERSTQKKRKIWRKQLKAKEMLKTQQCQHKKSSRRTWNEQQNKKNNCTNHKIEVRWKVYLP